ncbi:collectin-12-like isoform X2 [Palaemon carinicauda]|uniref:collectin-12-like isoform X2 n=1 Tax=Palaemon carinicauda TaxID=392227 RepID=UPI0035B6034C
MPPLKLYLVLAQIMVGVLASPTNVRPRMPYYTSTPWWYWTTRPYPTPTRWWSYSTRPYPTSTRWWTPSTRSYPTSTPSWEVTTAKPSVCEKPFVEISDRCVFVDPFVKGSWVKSRYLCHELSAELAIIDDAQFFHDLLKFIRSEGLDQESYWVGGSDDDVEGEWRWVNGKAVEFGSPFWALMSDGEVYTLRPGENLEHN